MSYRQHLKNEFIEITGKDPESFDELAECMKIIINSKIARPWQSPKRKNTPPVYYKIVGLAWDIKYSESVSNSHCAPIHGVQNWDRRSGAPTGYRGFSGRIHIRMAEDLCGTGSDLFDSTVTYTGSGGSGSYSGPWERVSTAHYRTYQNTRPDTRPHCYSWEWRFFLDDFPGLEAMFAPAYDKYQKEKTWSILKDPGRMVKNFVLENKYHWIDPETQKADEEFFLMLDI